jgi:hypothetical protein
MAKDGFAQHLIDLAINRLAGSAVYALQEKIGQGGNTQSGSIK